MEKITEKKPTDGIRKPTDGIRKPRSKAWRFFSRFSPDFFARLVYTGVFLIVAIVYVIFVIVSTSVAVFSSNEVDISFAVMMIIVSVAYWVAAIIAFFWIGGAVSRSIKKPMRKIIDRIDQISAENLSDRMELDGAHGELGEIAEQINNMLESIENSFDQQKYFVSDASHELKTPISVIHGYAELLKRWGKNDPEVLNESVDAIYSETQNMKHIVEQLLHLAKIDSFEYQPSEIDVTALAQEIVANYIMQHPDKVFTTSISDSLTVMAEKSTLIELIRILIDNAVKYSAKGGNIHLNCHSDPAYGKTVIQVSDDGIGISKEDLPRIFDRFYRCDKSRSRDDGSIGLGLSIAKSITDMLGGKITCRSKIGSGTTFTIVL